MNKRSWKSLAGAFVVVALLILVINPELRAFLLLVDLIGIETVLLLFATQLRANWPLIAGNSRAAATLFGRIKNRMLDATRWWVQGLLPPKGVWLTAEAVGIMCFSGLLRLATGSRGANGPKQT